MTDKERLQQLDSLVEEIIQNCFRDVLQYDVCKVRYELLDSLDFIVSVEPPYSDIEELLRHKQPEFAKDLGHTINCLAKGELMLRFTEKISIPVTNIFLMQADSASKFALFVLQDYWQSLHENSLKQADSRLST